MKSSFSHSSYTLNTYNNNHLTFLLLPQVIQLNQHLCYTCTRLPNFISNYPYYCWEMTGNVYLPHLVFFHNDWSPHNLSTIHSLTNTTESSSTGYSVCGYSYVHIRTQLFESDRRQGGKYIHHCHSRECHMIYRAL